MPASIVNAAASITDYASAHAFFTSASDTAQRSQAVKVCNNTYLRRTAHVHEGTVYELVFHGSAIVRYFAGGCIQLDACGFRTPTTRHRMTQFSPFGVSFGRVATVSAAEYIRGDGSQARAVYSYHDGITFRPTGVAGWETN